MIEKDVFHATLRPTLVEDVFDADTREQLRQMVATLQRDEPEHDELFTFGRVLVRNHALLTALQAELTKRVSGWVGEEIEPCYNFLRIFGVPELAGVITQPKAYA